LWAVKKDIAHIGGCMKFRKKPVVIEATQWFKKGDHPSVTELPYELAVKASVANDHAIFTVEYGWCPTLEGGHIVSPGDWIITGIKGEHYPCKPDIFEETYEIVDE
jgi:hypothetical protein